MDANAISVLEDLPMRNLFPELNAHIMDLAVEDNHIFPLIKKVSKTYSKIRLYHLVKITSEKATGENVRKKLTKLFF